MALTIVLNSAMHSTGEDRPIPNDSQTEAKYAKDSRAESKKPRLQTAERAVAVLLSVARSVDGKKAIEISDELGLTRQVTYHLLHTLHGTGMLRKNTQNRYVLGLAAFPIAEGFKRQLTPTEIIAPAVRSAVVATGETAYASGWVDGEIVVLATARGRSAVQAAEVPLGFSGNTHARATGKLLLALSDVETQLANLRSDSLVPVTRHTLTDQKKLIAHMGEIRQQRYATDLEEFSYGLCCLAVPIEGFVGQLALGISVPTERFHANFENYLEALLRIARGVSNDETATAVEHY